MAYNLHYEINGMACISAAIPNKRRGSYTAFRQLEWSVGFSPHFRFVPLRGGAEVRYTPGCVGALSGRTKTWHISMNAAPSAAGFEINYRSLPVSWVLRQALARDEPYDDTVDWLLRQTVIRRAYALITCAHAACWIVMDPEISYVQQSAGYPDKLIVRNSEYEESATPREYSTKLSDAPYQADDGAWVLDRYAVKL